MIFRNWIMQNFPFLEDDFDALTDYELFCKMAEYMKESLKKVNDFQKQIDLFQNKLDEFQNYFDNLDIQEEVNTKLDEMAEDGTLENIISEYIQLQTTYTYNNVAAMKEATNLVNGSFTRTSGFYNYNDGGGALYKVRTVTNSDTVDEKFIIALSDNTLVAELLFGNDLNIKQIGAKGDDSTDDSSVIQAAINKLASIGGNLIFPKSIYLLESGITVPVNNELINFIGNNSSLKFNIDSGIAISAVASSSNYCRVTFKDFTILYTGSGEEVNGIKLQKVTERKIIDNVRINGFYNNIMLKDCWNLNFEKLISIYATNDGLHCEDVTNGFNFNSCIFTHNAINNINLIGRGHVFNCCDLSIYVTDAKNYINGCSGVCFNGCYFEESSNPTNPFQIKASRGVSFNGCYFEVNSNAADYKLLDLNSGYGVSFVGCEFRSRATQDDTAYLIYLREGSACLVSNSNFRDCKKVCFVINSQLSVDNNKLETVTSFITQNNHAYARIVGNLEFNSEYEACTLPHKEVVHLIINNVATFGNTAGRPNGFYTGQTYYNTQTSHLDIYNGSAWVTT